jgi:uncharacterized protein
MKAAALVSPLLILCAPALACAAGFDCTTARTPRERLVCAEDTLSSADGKLNELYTSALSRLSPEGGELLRRSQRGWLRYVDAFCPMVADPTRRARAVSCISQAYSDRMRDLQFAAVQNGPFLFSRIDKYSVSEMTTPASQYDTGLARHHVAYPRIDRPATELTARWNRLVVREDEGSACDSGEGDTWTDYSLGLATANLISLTWGISDYCHGAPHGFGRNEAQTLVLSPQPHPFAPSDLFRPDAPWEERLTALLLAGAQKAARDHQVALDDTDTANIAQIARDTRRWSLGADGLGVQFSPYEIGPYIFQPHVVIPWSDLRDVMVPRPPVL